MLDTETVVSTFGPLEAYTPRLLPPVIGLYSPLPQMGKSTATDYLVHKFGYTRVRFAAGVKAIAGALLCEIGVPLAEIDDYVDGGRKEEPLSAFGFPRLTSRIIQQAGGTEFGRDCLDSDIWVTIAVRKAIAIVASGGRAVIDDLRFPNEYEAIKGVLGGECWRIFRAGAEEACRTAGHRSEGQLERSDFDARFANSGTIADFHDALARHLRRGGNV